MTAFSEAARQIVFGLHNTQPGVLAHGSRDLHWRHHGLGMLQAEFSEDLRIHIWHPALVNPGMAWPRCVHDHRFDLTSAVVLGEIIDVPCNVQEVPHPFTASLSKSQQWVGIYEIEHAKNQDLMVKNPSGPQGQKGCSTATSAKLLNKGYVEATGIERQSAGWEYRIRRREFHTTRIEGLTITVVHRSNFDDRLARVLCAIDSDVSAVSGIVRDDSLAHTRLVSNVIDQAADAIEVAASK